MKNYNYIIGRLAQSVERGANNAKVVGSRPTMASSIDFAHALILFGCINKACKQLRDMAG